MIKILTNKFYRTFGLVLAGAGLLLAGRANAQTASIYSFSQSNGTYTPITGGTTISQALYSGNGADDDETYTAFSLPFSFTFSGNSYTDFSVNTNGTFFFGDNATTDYLSIEDNFSPYPLVAGFATDLIGAAYTTATATSGSNVITNVTNFDNIAIGDEIDDNNDFDYVNEGSTITAIDQVAGTITLSDPATDNGTFTLRIYTGLISYTTAGTAPNRTFTVQWSGYHKYGQPGTQVNYQVVLHEGGGLASAQSIDVVYGTVIGNSNSYTVQAGIATSTTDFNSRTTSTDWTATTAATTNSQTLTYTNGIVPPSGLTYTWTPPAACAGVPTIGTLASSSPSVCANTTFYLTLTGNSMASGLTYQWQSSPAGAGTYTDITGATGSSLEIDNQTAATDYRVYVVCTISNLADTSATVSVGQNAASLCYCVSGIGGAGDPSIDSVVIQGTTLDNASPGYAPTFYTAYPQSGSTTASLAQGVTYNLHVGFSSAAISSIWIDYDHSGTYDASEWVQITTNSTPGDISFTVPGSAVLGTTGLRIRSRSPFNNNGATDACSTFGSGETEDYLITIVPGTPCSGQPSAGNVAASATSVCTNTAFTLTASGYTQGVTGVTLQWQSSPTGANTFTNIAGANNGTYTVASQTVGTDYRVFITCSNGNLGDTSALVTVNQNSSINCFCIPAGDCTNEGILNVTFAGINNTSAQCDNATGYTDFTALAPASVAQATVVPISVTAHVNSDPAQAGVWIDYDHSGTFDANEYTPLGTVTGAVGTDNVYTANVTIAATAQLGLTRMRVRSQNQDGLTSADACATFNMYGEAEDYLVNITAGTACTGQPTAGIVAADETSVCPNVAINLTATGYTTGTTGLNLQWQSSPAGANTFTNITGATNPTYTVTSQTTATDYRIFITCTNSTLGDTSAAVTVAENTVSLCYCTNLGGGGYPAIDSVHIFGTTLINSTPTQLNGPNYQTIYPASGNTTATLDAGIDYTIHVSLEAFADGFAGMWIDYDHSGTFDANEYVDLIDGNANDGTVTFTVPGTALTGLTGMRVRSNYDFESLSSSDGCSFLDGGETEDYYITIAPGTPCTGTPATGVAAASLTNACPGVPFTLSATGYTAGVTGVSFQWLSRPAGTGAFTPITGATTASSYTVANQTAATDYELAVICSGSTLVDTSNIVTVGENGPSQCYCTPSYITGCTEQDDINDFSLVGANSTSINDVATGCSPGAYDDRTNESVQMLPGNAYSGSLSTEFFDDEHAAMWIDFDNSGTFDAGEEVGTVDDISETGSAFTITIPAGAAAGTHRMRIREVYGTDAVDIDPCAQYNFGETHDYTAIIGCATPLTVNLGNDTSICAGTTITLDAGNAGSGYAYSNGASTETTAVGPGTYSVVVTSTTGCTGTDTITISTAPTVTVNLGNDTTICSGATITLDAGNAGSSFAYSNGANTQTTSVGPGTYSVTVTSPAGCTGTDNIVISAAPNLVVNLGNDTAICPGSTITLDAGNFGAGASYAYSNGALTETTSVGPGAYSVTVTNAAGCSGTDNIVIGGANVPVVNLGPDTAICGNSVLMLDAGFGTGYLYSWTGGSSTTEFLNVSAAGTYSVTVTNPTGCSATDSITITNIPLPTVTGISVNGNFDPAFGFGPQGAANTTLYGWSFGDGTTSTALTPTHSYNSNGAYTVVLVVANICGVDSVSTIVNVHNALSIGTTTLDNASLSLYPNPVSNFFVLEAKDGVQMQSVTVLNNLGAVVYQSNSINANRQVVNIDNLAAGIYNVRVQTDKGIVNRRIEAVPVR